MRRKIFWASSALIPVDKPIISLYYDRMINSQTSGSLPADTVIQNLSAEEISRGLGTRVMGRQVYCHSVLSSTMDEALRLAEAGAPEGTLVTAEAQTKGRGRMGRTWVSLPGSGLCFSLLLRPVWSPGDIAFLTLMAAVSMAESLQACAGIDCRIKWPNDVLFNGRKLAGILLEARTVRERVEFVALGIGVNFLPPGGELSHTAIALSQTGSRGCSREILLQAFLRGFERRYFSFSEDGRREILREWEKRSAVAGRRVGFDLSGQKTAGTALGLADDGGLMVALDDGRVIKRTAGEIYL